MSESITFVELLAELGGAKLLFHRDDATLAVAVLELPGDRQLLAIERTYREGTAVIFDPAPDELAIAREGDLWDLWNSERARLVYELVRRKERSPVLFEDDEPPTTEGGPAGNERSSEPE